MLVEELMVLANEAVGGFLSGRNREALYRVHERPDPQAVEHLLAKLTDLGVPTPPVPDRADAAARGTAGRRDLGACRRVHRAVGARARGVSRSRAPCAQAGSLRPEEPRPFGSCEPRLLPLHLTDPAVPRPRRAPSAAARARARRRPAARPTWRARRPHVRARARGSRNRVPRRRDLSRLAARAPALRNRLGRAFARRDHRSDQLGAFRAASGRCSRAFCRPAGCTASSSS